MAIQGYTKFTTARWKRTLLSLEKFNDSLEKNFGDYLANRLLYEIQVAHMDYDFGIDEKTESNFHKIGVFSTGFMMNRWVVQARKEGRKTIVTATNPDPKARKVEFGFEPEDLTNLKPIEIQKWLDNEKWAPTDAKEKKRLSYAITKSLQKTGFGARPVLRVALDSLKRYNKEFASLDFDSNYAGRLLDRPISDLDD